MQPFEIFLNSSFIHDKHKRFEFEHVLQGKKHTFFKK